MRIFTFLFVAFIFVGFYQVQAQSTPETFLEAAPNVFLDCKRNCDFDAFRNNIDYVNFVRDRQSADVNVLVTSQKIGSGGQKHILYFTGLGDYHDIEDTLTVITHNDDSRKLVSDAIMGGFKQGILAYLLHSPLRDKITYHITIPSEQSDVDIPVDPWDSWVFSLGTSGYFSGESSYKNFSLRGRIRANRITKQSKINLSANLNYQESNFYFRDSINEVLDSNTITSIRRSRAFNASYIHSLTDHISLGAFYSIFQNITRNYQLSNAVSFGAEYNFYTYDESDRHQLTLTYKIGPKHHVYVEESVFGKSSEFLFFNSINLALYQKQNWGNVGVGLSFSNYLHDIQLNRISLNTDIDWNVAKGLTFGLGGFASLIHDQINLPKSQANIEEVLLRNRLFATNYSLFAFFNIRYTFGSKYNNVVNSRFSEGGNLIYFF